MQRTIDRDRLQNAPGLKLPPMRSQHVSASDTQSADSYLRSRTIPIASPPCPPSRAFVQSGFNEVALSAKPRRHRRATSQNPPDSQISGVLIQHAGWDGGQHGWANLIPWIFANGRLQRLDVAGCLWCRGQHGH
jgi:hypothetical protein